MAEALATAQTMVAAAVVNAPFVACGLLFGNRSISRLSESRQ